MSDTFLAVSTALVLGTGIGGLAFAAVREAPAMLPSTVPVTASPSATPEGCSRPASDDPVCVSGGRPPAAATPTSTPVSAATAPARRPGVSGADGGGDDGTADQGRGDRGGAVTGPTPSSRATTAPHADDRRGHGRGSDDSPHADDRGGHGRGSDDSGGR